eukprot:scaffold63705_cov34-Prasinocladus_malaysianus.AAC.1
MDRDDVVQAVKDDNLAVLLDADQCRREMAAGNTFVGLQEAPITFQPTYKFDKATTNPYVSDCMSYLFVGPQLTTPRRNAGCRRGPTGYSSEAPTE